MRFLFASRANVMHHCDSLASRKKWPHMRRHRDTGNKSRLQRRRMLIEPLEDRRMLATEWANAIPNGTVWLEGETHIIKEGASLPASATLTIEPAVRVLFETGVGLPVAGTLNAIGNSQRPILFSSVNDDFSDSTPDPAPGDWTRLEVTGTATLDYVNIAYGGASTDGPAEEDAQLFVNGGEVTFSNGSSMHSRLHGVRIEGASPTFLNIAISENGGTGFGQGAGLSMDLFSDPDFVNVDIEDNDIDAVLLDSGTITSDISWNDPEVVYTFDDDIVVADGATLAIDAGQVVKVTWFPQRPQMIVNGALQSEGTESSPVIFTTVDDDSVGGDTINDGDGDPSGRYWGGFELTGPANEISWTEIRYAGLGRDASVDAALALNGGGLELRDSLILQSAMHGMRIEGSDPLIQRTTFIDNNDAAISMDLSSNPTILGDSPLDATGNRYNGVLIDGGTATEDLNWTNPDAAYVVDNPIIIPEGRTLSVGAGQVIKFRHHDAELIVNGTLEVVGAAGGKAIFTDLFDDGAGGDTNGDGTATQSAAGNWSGITLTGSANTIDHAEIRYAGYFLSDALLLDEGELTLSNSVLRDIAFGRAGLRIQNSDPQVSDTTFAAAGNAISMDLASQPTLNGLTFTGNTVNGVILDGGDLTSDSIWNNPEVVYYMPEDIRVAPAVSLNIVPNKVVKLRQARNLIVDGTLHAEGLPGSPVILTSLSDDTLGETLPGAGFETDHWGRVQFTELSSGNTLDHVEIRAGGESANDSAIFVDGGPLTLTNARIVDSDYVAVRIENADPTIRNVSIENGPGAAFSMDLGSSPLLTSIALDNNGINGVLLDAGEIPQNMVWDNSELVYQTSGRVVVPPTRTLKIAPGQIIKFSGSSTFPTEDSIVVNGRLEALGTVDAPIIMTNSRDDTAGGQTDNDGDVFFGGFWPGLVFNNTGSDSRLENVDLRYAPVTVDDTNVTILNSHFQQGPISGVLLTATNGATVDLMSSILVVDNYGSALDVQSSSVVTAVNNTIDGARSDNAHTLVKVDNATLNLTNNILSGFRGYGVDVTGDSTVNASHNIVYGPEANAAWHGIDDQTGTNGNIAADPLFLGAENLQFQLREGSSAIDSGSSDSAPATDFLGNQRFDHAGVENTGAGTEPFFDRGAIEAQLMPQSDVDLVATRIGVTQLDPENRIASLVWGVRNNGFANAEAPWHDAIYLSNDTLLTPDDLFLGDLEHDRALGPRGTYSAFTDVTVPEELDGKFYFIVRVDSRNVVYEGGNLDNNSASTGDTADTDIRTLILDTPATDLFSSKAQTHYYGLEVPPGSQASGTLVVALDSAAESGANELYIRRGVVPTRNEFEVRFQAGLSPDQEVSLPIGQFDPGGTFYVMVYSRHGEASNSSYTLTATIEDLTIDSISPQRGSSAGSVTVGITGSEFSRDATAVLVAPDGTEIEDTRFYHFGSTEVYATFDLQGLPTDVYDIRVDQGAFSSVLEDAFTVTDGPAGTVTATLAASMRFVLVGRAS